MVIMIDYEMMY